MEMTYDKGQGNVRSPNPLNLIFKNVLKGEKKPTEKEKHIHYYAHCIYSTKAKET